MSRDWVLLIAAMASFCGLARADVKIALPIINAKVGATAIAKCTVTGGEGFLGWYKPDGSKITTSSTENIRVESSGNEHKLRFVDVKVSYGSDDYECRGSKTTAKLRLHVAVNIEKVDKIQHISIGKDDTIKLGVSGFPKPSFKWKRGNTALNPDSRLSVLAEGSLKIKKVTRSDRGNYTCTVEQGSTEESVKIEVYAVEMPKIKPFSMPQRYLTEGYSATFLCEATGFPVPQYKWLTPDGQQINSFGNVYVDGGNLTFISVDNSMKKGEYKCVAYIEIEETKEQIGKASAVVDVVDVFVAPEIDRSQGVPVMLKRGDDYKLKCVATGNPLPVVTWKKDGVEDPRQQQTKGQSVIEFQNIQVGDGGVYTCEASSRAVDGQGNTIVKTLDKAINIESKPFVNTVASPKEVYSFIGNSDPTFVRCKYGGYPAPFVTLRFKDKLLDNATTVAEVELKTDALKHFGVYKCHAKNKFGSTNYTVELKLAKAPSEVQNLQGVGTCKSITLTWLRPKDDGGMPINKYVLNYKDDKSVTRNVDGDETSYTIDKLKQNTEYNFALRATNRAEWGPVSNVKVKTTEYCVPGRPIIYSPTSTLITTDSFILKWRRPTETGGDDDITYTVRYRIEKDQTRGPWKTFTTKELQMEITDLDSKNQYKFEVIAKNKGGESLPDERYIQTNFPEEQSAQVSLVSSAFLIIFVGGFFHVL